MKHSVIIEDDKASEGEINDESKQALAEQHIQDSDFEHINSKEHIMQVANEIKTYSTKQNDYNWDEVPRSLLIPTSEQMNFLVKPENLFEVADKEQLFLADFLHQEKVGNEAIKEVKLNVNSMEVLDVKDAILLAKTGKQLGDFLKKDLTGKEKTDLSTLENNLTKIREKHFKNKELNLILAAISSYRHVTATKRLAWATNISEIQKVLQAVFVAAKDLSTNQRPTMFAGSKLTGPQKDKYVDFLDDLQDYFDSCFQGKQKYETQKIDFTPEERVLLKEFSKKYAKIFELHKRASSIYL